MGMVEGSDMRPGPTAVVHRRKDEGKQSGLFAGAPEQAGGGAKDYRKDRKIRLVFACWSGRVAEIQRVGRLM